MPLDPLILVGAALVVGLVVAVGLLAWGLDRLIHDFTDSIKKEDEDGCDRRA